MPSNFTEYASNQDPPRGIMYNMYDSSDSEASIERLPINRKKVSKLTKEQKEKNSKLWAEIKEIDKQRNPRPGKKADRRFVAAPSKILEGDTPIRPFTEELLWHDGNVSGTAAQIFEMVYPNRRLAGHIPWRDGNFSAPANHCDFLEQANQDKLRTYKGVPEEVKKQKKFKEILENVQEVLWIIHYNRVDASLERTFNLMIQKFMCRFDENRRLKLITITDLSLAWNRNISAENASIMCQREKDWELRPVFVDGLAFTQVLLPSTDSKPPKLPIRALVEILLHFILDGHETVLYLPEIYQKSADLSDNIENIHALSDMNLVRFVDTANVESLESFVLQKAEDNYGIVVSPCQDLPTHHSVQCYPTVYRYSPKVEEFMLTTIFKKCSISTPVVEKTNTKIQKNNADFDLETIQKFKTTMLITDEIFEWEDSFETDISENEADISPDEEKSDIPTFTAIPSKDSGVDVDCSTSGNLNEHESTTPETLSNISSGSEEFQCYQTFSMKCRLHSDSEKRKFDTFSNQLTLKRQVLLVFSDDISMFLYKSENYISGMFVPPPICVPFSTETTNSSAICRSYYRPSCKNPCSTSLDLLSVASKVEKL
ncbi:Protein CBR-ERI-9 [Caenorhabditis briggsae]|uniref:Protein CBR-ERI-9 n=1 Tax=Caenorhabditis briggsae TaxID=6238 RepID=A8XT86_CAEBR|nr:Protein CBR-ERI-9 [Caenorhabditis briggsae]CAP35689.2 Protein CBR-ERI-9 [Caenorhabditis briggsae]